MNRPPDSHRKLKFPGPHYGSCGYTGAEYDPTHPWGSPILCPDCNSAEMHPISVSAWMREEDQDGGGVKISHPAPGKPITTGSIHDREDARVQILSPRGNPSDRREGIVIEIACLICDTSHKLVFRQHKGPTYVGWQDPKK